MDTGIDCYLQVTLSSIPWYEYYIPIRQLLQLFRDSGVLLKKLEGILLLLLLLWYCCCCCSSRRVSATLHCIINTGHFIVYDELSQIEWREGEREWEGEREGGK